MVSILPLNPVKNALPKKIKQRLSQPNPVTARELLLLLADGPIAWRDLVKKSRRDTPQEIKQLRLMVKGMQRNGEVQRDHTGDYHALAPGAEVVGDVVAVNKRLYVDGIELESSRKQTLRPGDKVVARVVGDRARVVDVVAYSDEPVFGILRWRGRYPFVEAMSTMSKGKISLADPPSEKSGAKDGDTVSVRVVGRDQRGLVGELLDVLVSDSVVDQAIRTTMHAQGIPTDWPKAVDRAVAELSASVAASRYPNRHDLRALPLVTIDGETARDFDDAVFAEQQGTGWRLVVAIADVGHYVKPGSALDQEAQIRGTSVYFPGHVVPMLPEALSNELCSLKPNVPRLAMVCDMRVSKDGRVEGHDFYEAVIQSHARLTYEEVQVFLDGASIGQSPQVSLSLGTLHDLYLAFRVAREQRGGLDFTSRECEIELRDGRVRAVQPVARVQTHQLIEEAMIAANVAAAEFLEAQEVVKQESVSLYRVHESPDLLKLEELREGLAVTGITLESAKANPHTLKQVLQKLGEVRNGWLYEQMVLRCMKQAVYTPNNQGHFGLALARYMHFTSPIRRYPDLLVHRAIKAVLANKPDSKRHRGQLPDMDSLQQLGEQCSHTERRAETAGWAVDSWLKCDYVGQHIGEVVDGLVAGVTDFGIFVEISGYYVQGLVHISELGSDYFHFSPQTASLVGERSGRRFSLGDELKVKIVDVDPPQGRVDLQIAGSAPSNKNKGHKRG
jgi:ribonuclease R